jgi:outer membrane protein TolC
MKRLLVPLALLLSALPLTAQETVVRLQDLPGLVLAHDLGVDTSTQTALAAYKTFQGTVAQSLPQVDLSTTYALDYLPLQETQSFLGLDTPPYLQIERLKTNDQANHTLGAKVSLSQILPTAGTLSLAVSHQMSTNAYSTQDSTINGVTTTSGGTAQFAQKPVVTLGLTQPLFINGKLIDLGLFPATIQKAEIGYQKADASRIAQTNQSVAQAAQLFLTAVQLRKNIAQTGKALAVTEGNLDTMQRNFDLGLAAEADLLDAKITLSNQQQGMLALRSSLRKTELSLAHAMGRESLEGVTLSEDIPAIDLTIEAEELARRAEANHPLIRQQALAAQEKRVDDILSGQKYASTLSLSLTYTPRYPFSLTNNPYYDTDLGKSFSDLYGTGSTSDITLSAGLTVHLFDGGQQEAARAGNAALTRIAENSLRSQKLAIRDQVENDLLQKASLEEKIVMLEAASSLASRRLETERTLLGLGKSTDLSVASRQADTDSKQNELWRARADLFNTLLDLSYMAGEDIARSIEGTSK